MSEATPAVPRLTRTALAAARAEGLPSRVTPPRTDAATLGIGIVHFGLGAFHRAHQAVFTEDAAAAAGDTRWGIFGVTGRSDAVVRQLQPQDGLYGVLTRDAHEKSLRLVGSIRDVAWPGDRSGDVVDVIAAPTTHLATLTLTEQGYPRAVDGALDAANPDVAADRVVLARELVGAQPPEASRTPLGLLVRGLARRYREGGGGFTVVCCDNLAHGGAVVRSLVHALASGSDAGFESWLAASVTFPSTMVDRITPATADADRALARELLGLDDAGLVVAEPFGQWVIEDDFAGPRPPWELAGAIITDDVAPYETAKLRVLNATHLLLAWTGSLCGYRTIAEAVADPRLRELARTTIDDDILPTLVAPAGLDLPAYRDSVLARFANPALAHTTAQVGANGSQKLPHRIVGTVLDRLAAGEVPRGLALVVAAWASVIAASLAPGGATLDDPAAEELRARVGSAEALRAEPDAVVRRLLRFSVFPDAMSHPGFRAAVVEQLATVHSIVEGTQP